MRLTTMQIRCEPHPIEETPILRYPCMMTVLEVNFIMAVPKFIIQKNYRKDQELPAILPQVACALQSIKTKSI